MFPNKDGNRRSVRGNVCNLGRTKYNSSSLMLIRSTIHPLLSRSVVSSGVTVYRGCNCTVANVGYERTVLRDRSNFAAGADVPHSGLVHARAPRAFHLKGLVTTRRRTERGNVAGSITSYALVTRLKNERVRVIPNSRGGVGIAAIRSLRVLGTLVGIRPRS